MLDLTGFNPEQHRAVVAESDPRKLKQLLILAGAGSGKTRVLTYRMAYLMREKKVHPSEILGVTFTRKAANEMKERLVPLIGGGALSLVELGTFHSISSNLLRSSGAKFVIIDAYEQGKLIKEIKKDNSQFDEVTPKNYLSWLSYERSKCHDPIKPSMDDDETVGLYRAITVMYFDHKKILRVVDFDDLIELAVKLLQRNESVRKAVQAKWKYLLVDEYQDTNNRQFQLLSLIRSPHCQLLMVGDEDQLIYSWRGAEIHNILKAYQESKSNADCECIELNKNYRSVGNILATADAVVSDNVIRTGKVMDSQKEKGTPVHIYDFKEESQESDRIVRLIKGWNAEGVKYGDMAILIRVNRLSRGLEKAFLKSKVPYVIHSGLSLFERREIRLLMAMMLFAENPHNSIYLSTIVDTIKMGVGPGKLTTLRFAAENHKGSVLEALKADKVSKTNPIAARFVEVITKMQGKISEGKLLSSAHVAMKEMNIMVFFKEDMREKAEENILLMFEVIEDYEHEATKASVSDFQEERLLNNELTEKSDEGSVNIMTIHKSKGLEFSHGVFLGLQDGLIPSESSAPKDELEEDRRVAYVGITRFENQLVITRCRYRVGFDKVNAARGSSSFIDPHLGALLDEGAVKYSRSSSVWGN